MTASAHPTTDRPARVVIAVAVLGCFWFLSLPLRDVLAFPTRIAVLPNLEADAAAYDSFARDLAARWELSALPAKHPPGWMVLLALVYSAAGPSLVAGKLVSWAALGVTVLLAAWLAHRLFGRDAAIAAALLTASSPGLRAYVGTLQYEVVTAGLFALFVATSCRVVDAARLASARRWAIAAGLVGAALILTRETFVLVVPLTTGWVWRQSAVAGTRQRLSVATLMIAVAATPPLLWSAAQTAHHGRLILVSEKGPKEFQLGNNPLANGTYNEPLAGMGEPAGVPFIRAEPLAAVRLAGRKVLYLFGVIRDGWSVPHPAATWLWRATTGVVPLWLIEPILSGGWLLVGVLAGLVQLGANGWRRWWMLPMSVALILGVHVITLGSYRFAVPLLPMLYVLASGPVASLANRLTLATRTPVTAIAAAVLATLAVAAQFATWPLTAEYRAVHLEGIAGINRPDDLAGRDVRVGPGARGIRPLALLPHAHLPDGEVMLTVRVRRLSDAPSPGTLVAALTLVPLDGSAACARELTAAEVPTDAFRDFALPCQLPYDGPATVAVMSGGVVDLAVDTVQLTWYRP